MSYMTPYMTPCMICSQYIHAGMSSTGRGRYYSTPGTFYSPLHHTYSSWSVLRVRASLCELGPASTRTKARHHIHTSARANICTTSHEDANTVSLIVIEYCKLNNTSVLIKHTFRPFPDRVALLDIPLEKLSRSLDSACVCLSYHGHGL